MCYTPVHLHGGKDSSPACCGIGMTAEGMMITCSYILIPVLHSVPFRPAAPGSLRQYRGPTGGNIIWIFTNITNIY